MNRISRIVSGTQNFFGEVNGEMHKVSWPTRPQVIASTIVVVIATALMSIFIFAEDQCLKWLLEQILFRS